MNNNKFLTLLMGECWHKWERQEKPIQIGFDLRSLSTNKIYPDYICKICKEGIFTKLPARPDHLSNPLPVIQWMEKEMPEVWDHYIDEMGRPDISNARWLSKVLDLNNLVTYLSEYREWGETVFHAEEGLNIIKHPALVYLEEQCEK